MKHTKTKHESFIPDLWKEEMKKAIETKRIFDELDAEFLAIKFPEKTPEQKFKNELEELQHRIEGALKVLRGEAEACDGYCED